MDPQLSPIFVQECPVSNGSFQDHNAYSTSSSGFQGLDVLKTMSTLTPSENKFTAGGNAEGKVEQYQDASSAPKRESTKPISPSTLSADTFFEEEESDDGHKSPDSLTNANNLLLSAHSSLSSPPSSPARAEPKLFKYNSTFPVFQDDPNQLESIDENLSAKASSKHHSHTMSFSDAAGGTRSQPGLGDYDVELQPLHAPSAIPDILHDGHHHHKRHIPPSNSDFYHNFHTQRRSSKHYNAHRGMAIVNASLTHAGSLHLVHHLPYTAERHQLLSVCYLGFAFTVLFLSYNVAQTNLTSYFPSVGFYSFALTFTFFALGSLVASAVGLRIGVVSSMALGALSYAALVSMFIIDNDTALLIVSLCL